MNWYNTISHMSIEVGVLKQRRSDKQIVSRQIGDATHQHELAIEHYPPKGIPIGIVHMFFFEFEKNSEVFREKKKREFSTWE